MNVTGLTGQVLWCKFRTNNIKVSSGLTVLRKMKRTVSLKNKTYDVILHPDFEEGGFWVECPSLPGCATQGDTVEVVLEMIKDAIKGHLAIAAELKKKRVDEREQHAL